MFHVEAGFSASRDKIVGLFELNTVRRVFEAHQISEPWFLTHGIYVNMWTLEVLNQSPGSLAV